MCPEVTVEIISSSDQKSWMKENCFLFSVNSSLRLNPGISFESGEAVSGKYFISLSRTQPLPAHSRGMLGWCLTTFLNYTSCTHWLSAPFGCISSHGSDLHLPVWWYSCLLLATLLFVCSSFRSEGFKQTPPNSACRGWSRVNLKSFEGCCLQIMKFQPLANCSFCSFLCFSVFYMRV